jgi:hypothetical protein
LRKEYQGSDILHVGLLPRHIEVCCNEKNHMEGEDVVMLHGSRREFDRQVKLRLDEKMEFVEWYVALGLDDDPGIRDQWWASLHDVITALQIGRYQFCLKR